MPRTTQTIRVLISSPLDLKRDRRVAVTVVDEVNRLLGEFHHVQLEPWTCENRVPSGVAADAQEHVTRELGDYDFYVGMMWTRFGSPTPRAGSGTAEEFNDAIARRRADPASMEVMFYFCERPLDPAKVDARQREAVRAFRDTIRRQGVFDRQYRSSNELRTILLYDLMKYARRWDARHRATDPPTLGRLAAAVLDWFREAESAREQLLVAMATMLGEATAAGQASRDRTERAKAESAAGVRMTAERWRLLVREGAGDITRLARSLERDSPAFNRALWALLTLWARILGASVAVESLAAKEAEFRAVLRDLRNKLHEFSTNLTGEGHVLEGLRLGEAVYDRAAARAARGLHALASEVRDARDLLDRVVLQES